MVCVKWCAVCMRETLHSGIRDTCTACKSNKYRARKAEVPPDSIHAKLVELEEKVYDIRKSLS